jgi:hypothetical protein
VIEGRLAAEVEVVGTRRLSLAYSSRSSRHSPTPLNNPLSQHPPPTTHYPPYTTQSALGGIYWKRELDLLTAQCGRAGLHCCRRGRGSTGSETAA